MPSVPEARIERAGTQRWLVINRPPEAVLPTVREFWQQAGFLIAIDSPETGIIETDWAENRAKLPDDFIRRTIGKVFEGLYSTGERDKFRTRLERTDQGTEIYISHRGMEETYTTTNKDQTVWQPRKPDPELEAEFLRRLMLALGVDNQRAKAQLAGGEQQRARLVRENNAVVAVMVDEGFDRAWRRVGLALDRVGFTVEDRDRNKGIYFVRYDNPEISTQNKEPGFFSRLLSFGGKKKEDKPIQYRIQVVQGNSSENSQITIANIDGQPERTEAGSRILALLQEQLK